MRYDIRYLTKMTPHALMTISDLTLHTGHCTIGTMYFLLNISGRDEKLLNDLLQYDL